MQQFGAVFGQYPADQQAPVTVRRVLLAAHQGQAVHSGATFDARNSTQKLLVFAHLAVQCAPLLVIVALVARTSPYKIAKKEVLHPARSN